jgi:Polyphosphate kinase 2 (PPK2)
MPLPCQYANAHGDGSKRATVQSRLRAPRTLERLTTDVGHPGIRSSEGSRSAVFTVRRQSARLPGLQLQTSKPGDEKALWRDRYRSIVDLERHLSGNGTRIIKFYLHISKEEQRKRFLGRIDEPDKNWKFSLADIEERAFWKHYMKAYEKCLSVTSTSFAPWYVVPADDKQNARLIVSRIVLDALTELKMAYPKANAKRRAELLSIRKQLTR